MFEAFRDDTKRQCLYASNGFIAVSGIAHYTKQRRHFSQPAAIIFSFEFDREHHARTVHPCPIKGQPDALGMMALRFGFVRRRIARINAPLVARRRAALTRASRRRVSGNCRSAGICRRWRWPSIGTLERSPDPRPNSQRRWAYNPACNRRPFALRSPQRNPGRERPRSASGPQRGPEPGSFTSWVPLLR